MQDKIRKYAELLLKCVRLEDKKYLFVDMPNYLSEFKDILEDAAHAYDLEEIHFELTDPFKKHDLMIELDQEGINKHPMFDRSIFNKYAKLDAAFIFIESMIPDLMSDVDPVKIKDTNLHVLNTQKYFRELYNDDKLNWLIAGVPNPYWARDALNVSEEELWKLIFDVCLIKDDNDPYQDWLDKLESLQEKTDKLNNYNFEYLTYKNDLGTDLTVYLPEGHVWCSGKEESGCVVNLPTEEIFTSPQYDHIDGTVVATKPLIYNNFTIDDFYFKLENGEVVEYGASCGEEVLRNIVEAEDGTHFFGECALVADNSPINNTGVLFYSTLYDENASCHFAIGRGFPGCTCKKCEDLKEAGINESKIHVDFMIGDKSLVVTGVTHDGEEVIIMDKGNFVI